MFPVPIVPAASRHKQGLSVIFPKSIFCFFPVPLIEGCRGNGDASVEDAFPEKGPVRDSLTAGVDNQAFALLLLYGESPPEPGTGDSSPCRKKDGGFICRVYIHAADSLQGSCGFPAQLFSCLFYQLFHFICRFVSDMITSAHLRFLLVFRESKHPRCFQWGLLASHRTLSGFI